MDQYLYIPFLGGWTSINPSYFDVNYRGTRFWPIPILFHLPRWSWSRPHRLLGKRPSPSWMKWWPWLAWRSPGRAGMGRDGPVAFRVEWIKYIKYIKWHRYEDWFQNYEILILVHNRFIILQNGIMVIIMVPWLVIMKYCDTHPSIASEAYCISRWSIRWNDHARIEISRSCIATGPTTSP